MSFTTVDVRTPLEVGMELLESPAKKITDSFEWFTNRLVLKVEKLFSDKNYSPRLVAAGDKGNWCLLVINRKPEICPPTETAAECRRNGTTRKGRINVSVKIIPGSVVNGEFVLDKSKAYNQQFDIVSFPWMDADGSFTISGSDKALLTLKQTEKDNCSNFINPGMQLDKIYERELSIAESNFESNLRNYATIDLSQALSKTRLNSGVLTEIAGLTNFRYMSDNNPIGRAKIVTLVSRQDNLTEIKQLNEEGDLPSEPTRRDISERMLEFVDAFDKPEGKKNSESWVLNLQTRFQKDKDGNYTGELEAPFFAVGENGKILTDKVVWLSTRTLGNEVYTRYTGNQIPDDVIGFKKLTDEQVAKGQEKGFKYEKEYPIGRFRNAKKAVRYVSCTPFNYTSSASALSVYSDKNTSNRALMTDNFMNQMLIPLGAEAPLVQTGIEKLLAETLGGQNKADCSGIVIAVKDDKIVIRDKNQDEHTVPYQKIEKFNTKAGYLSNVLVKEGDRVEKGQPLIEQTYNRDGKLSYGINARIAHVEVETYKDIIAISESFAKKMSVCRCEDFDYEVHDREGATESITQLVKVGDMIKGGDRLAEISKTDLATQQTNTTPVTLPVKETEPWRVDSIDVIRDNLPKGTKEKLVYHCSRVHEMQNGDKLSNRHGCKGVVKILPDEEMPYTLSADGKKEPVEVCMSAISPNKRGNIGEAFECIAGKIAHDTGKLITISEPSADDIENLKIMADEEGVNITSPLYMNGKLINPDAIVGYEYMIELPHISAEKILVRSIAEQNNYNKETGHGRGDDDNIRSRTMGEMTINALKANGDIGEKVVDLFHLLSDGNFSRKNYTAIAEGRTDDKLIEQQNGERPVAVTNNLMNTFSTFGLEQTRTERKTKILISNTTVTQAKNDIKKRERGKEEYHGR